MASADKPPVVGSTIQYPVGPLAQLVEQLTLNQRAVGSTPTRPTIFSCQFTRFHAVLFLPPELCLIGAGLGAKILAGEELTNRRVPLGIHLA